MAEIERLLEPDTAGDPISGLRTGAKIISQIWSNRVVPSRNYFVRSEAQGRDQLWVGLEMGLILVSVEIGGHDQASFGAGGANEFEHLFVAVQRLGRPVFGDLGEQPVLDGVPFGSTGRIVGDGDCEAEAIA